MGWTVSWRVECTSLWAGSSWPSRATVESTERWRWILVSPNNLAECLWTPGVNQGRHGENMATISNRFRKATHHAISHHACRCCCREGHNRRLLSDTNRPIKNLLNKHFYMNMTCDITKLTIDTGFQVVEGAALGCQFIPPVSFFSPGWLQWISLYTTIC